MTVDLIFSAPLELKRAPGAGTFDGYASRFNSEPDSYGDVIAPGAYRETLADHRTRGALPLMLWSHDPSRPIGVWESIAEDREGLKVSGRLTLNSTEGADAYALLKDGALKGLSIGYRVKNSTRSLAGSRALRVLTAIELIEISVVALPAQRGAEITNVKTVMPTINPDPRSLEHALRDAGCSRAFAKAVLAHGYKTAAGLRDAGSDAVAAMVRDLKARTDTLNLVVKEIRNDR